MRTGADMPEVPRGTSFRFYGKTVRLPGLIRTRVGAGLDAWKVEGDDTWLEPTVKVLDGLGWRLEARLYAERDPGSGARTQVPEFRISPKSGRWP